MCLQVFDAKCKFSHSVDFSSFKDPRGLYSFVPVAATFDQDGNLVVLTDHNRVSFFKPHRTSAEFLTSFSAEEPRKPHAHDRGIRAAPYHTMACGVCVDAENRVFVCYSNWQRIEVFAFTDEPQPQTELAE